MSETFQTPPALTDYPLLSEDTDKPWSPKGRFGRLSYLGWTMLICLIGISIIAGFILLGFTLGISLFSAKAFGLLLLGSLTLIPLVYFMAVFQIRRLHDLNRTGWWIAFPFANSFIAQSLALSFGLMSQKVSIGLIILAISLLINILFAIYLMLAKGTDGVNQYGIQRATAQWEKVLGCIYIIFFPLGLSGNAFTINALYQGYKGQSSETPHSSQTVNQQTSTLSPTTTPATESKAAS